MLIGAKLYCYTRACIKSYHIYNVSCTIRYVGCPKERSSWTAVNKKCRAQYLRISRRVVASKLVDSAGWATSKLVSVPIAKVARQLLAIC